MARSTSMVMAFATAVFGLLALACESSPVPPGCTVGEQTACACVGGAVGAQVCQADGTLSTCECPGPCVPRSCAAAGAVCGEIDDGCGVPLVCGGCAGGRECTNNVCACPSGEVVLDDACDVDECVAGTYTCDADATCINTSGSWACECNVGFTGDGTSCDRDQCADGTDNCDADATCTDATPGFSCACNAGFLGDGTTCEKDIDTFIADYSTRPLTVSIPGVTDDMRIDRSSKISMEWSIVRVPQAQGSLPVYDALSLPPITFEDIRGTGTQVAELQAWIETGDARRVVVSIHGIGGELIGVGINGARATAIDATVRTDGVDSVLASMRVTGTGFYETDLSVEPSVAPNPAPAFWVEIAGIVQLTGTVSPFVGFSLDQVTPFVPGSELPLVLQGLPRHRALTNFFEQNRSNHVDTGLVDRRSMSLISADGSRVEIGRVNGFECLPTRVFYLDPTRDPALGFPSSIELVCALVEDG